MLKINLLPIRQLKKRAKARNQFIGMVFIFLLALAAIAAIGFIQIQNIKGLQQDIAALTKEKDSYTPTLKKIEKLKEDKLELARKTDIIKKLRKESSLTVRLLDEVANRVDNQRMWLGSLNQQNNSMNLTGIALDNQTVAQFMNKLKESPFITDVVLTNSSLQVVSGRNLKSFSLNCSVAYPPDPTTIKEGEQKGVAAAK
jgi:type IV pilus assembly protein PilN